MISSNKLLGTLSSSVLVICFSLLLSSCGTVREIGSGFFATTDFFRVETFPTGDEIAVAGLTRDKSIEHIYDAPYDKVWRAARRGSMRLEALSKQKLFGREINRRAIISIDAQNGRIQNGKIDELSLMVSGPDAWDDEFVFEVKQLSTAKTKVAIFRKVAKKVYEKGKVMDQIYYKPSSGNYERWILTQIEDDLTGKLKRESIAIVQLKPTERPNVTFVDTLRKRSLPSGFSLGLLKYSFTFDGAEQLRNLSGESSSFIQQLLIVYRDSLQSALDRIVLAQGFRTVGVFDNVEQMTYPQKQSSPLVLVRRVNLSIRESYDKNSVIVGEIKKNAVQDSLFPSTVRGKLTFSGRLLLDLYEPFSREKMWTNTIEIPPIEREISFKYTIPGDEYFGEQFDTKDVVHGEDTRPKQLGQMLSSGFTKMLDGAYDSLNPTELKQIFDLANELRSKRK